MGFPGAITFQSVLYSLFPSPGFGMTTPLPTVVSRYPELESPPSVDQVSIPGLLPDRLMSASSMALDAL